MSWTLILRCLKERVNVLSCIRIHFLSLNFVTYHENGESVSIFFWACSLVGAGASLGWLVLVFCERKILSAGWFGLVETNWLPPPLYRPRLSTLVHPPLAGSGRCRATIGSRTPGPVAATGRPLPSKIASLPASIPPPSSTPNLARRSHRQRYQRALISVS